MAERFSILLVENDIQTIETFRRVLTTVHPPIFDLYHAPRFLEAIQQIKQRPLHVVILDLGLPDSIGLNGAQRLMSMIPAVPVIVLTERDDDESALAGIALGAQELLDKTDVTPKQLIRTITRAIRRKQYWLSESGAEPGGADQKKLEELAAIMRRATAVVTSRVGTLMSTELTEEQRGIVADIEKTTLESAEAADRLSPEKVIFVEADPEPGPP